MLLLVPCLILWEHLPLIHKHRAFRREFENSIKFGKSVEFCPATQDAMMGTNILPRSSSSLFSLQLLLLLHVFFYSFVVTKVEGNECRLVMEKNEWAAGCIPAVNFVVKCKFGYFSL